MAANDTVVSDVKEIILDLPIATENKLRANMLISIFSNYGKYLLNRGFNISQVLKEVDSNISAFKEKNGKFCSADYYEPSLNNIRQYYGDMNQIKFDVYKDFISDSATYLKKYISDADIVSDLEKAEESLVSESFTGMYTVTFADKYLTDCIQAIKKSCSIDPGFLNRV